VTSPTSTTATPPSNAKNASPPAAATGASTTASPSGQEAFTDANLFAALLTLEGLAFAVVTTAIALSNQSGRVRKLVITPPIMAKTAASLVTALAVAATLAWAEIFGRDFPDRWLSAVGAIVILGAIIAQAFLAWLVALAARIES